MARVPPLPPARLLFQMERARDHQLLEHLFQAARRLGSSPGTFVPWRGPGERDAQRVCASGKFVPGGSGSAAGSDSSSGTFLPDSRSAQPHSQAITSRRTPCRLRHDPAGDSRVRRSPPGARYPRSQDPVDRAGSTARRLAALAGSWPACRSRSPAPRGRSPRPRRPDHPCRCRAQPPRRPTASSPAARSMHSMSPGCCGPLVPTLRHRHL
jgi:hypothetical protein